METNWKLSSFNALNVGALLLILSIVGNTPRFIVISLTLISWLRTQWLRYVSISQKRRSSSPDKRQERVLKVTQDAERRRDKHEQVIVKGIIDRLIEFQESERLQLEAREDMLLIAGRKIKNDEASLQALQKKLEEREQKVKLEEDKTRKMRLKQDQELKDREEQLLIRGIKIKKSEAALQELQEKLEEREQKAKAAEDGARKMQQKQNKMLKDREGQLLSRESKLKESEAALDVRQKRLEEQEQEMKSPDWYQKREEKDQINRDFEMKIQGVDGALQLLQELQELGDQNLNFPAWDLSIRGMMLRMDKMTLMVEQAVAMNSLKADENADKSAAANSIAKVKPSD